MCQKASQSSSPAGDEAIKIIFDGGVYVGKNTDQAASVRVVRQRRAMSARSRLQSFCRKSPKGFFDSLKCGIRKDSAFFTRFQIAVTVYVPEASGLTRRPSSKRQPGSSRMRPFMAAGTVTVRRMTSFSRTHRVSIRPAGAMWKPSA